MMKLLYVEDEADIREIAEFALEDEGFDIVFCESGEQAVARAGDFQPEAILLDVMMPGMDRPTTLQNLRTAPGLQNTPVIFLTAKVQPNEIKDFIALGAIDVIPKPFDPMTLADQVRDILRRNS
jgi:two-component system OmpR family response regulator